jgi:predicted nucleic acid-binding protein
MRLLLSRLDASSILAADAGTIINLNATGCASHILRALPPRVVLMDAVVTELEGHSARGLHDAALIGSGDVSVASLGEKGLEVFETLVVGAAVATLDDGEAATLAYAVETGGVPVIDASKARRIWSERGYSGFIASTVDLLAHPAVEDALGRAALSDAVFAALQNARMPVSSEQVDWVDAIVGQDRAAKYKASFHGEWTKFVSSEL